MRIMRKSFAVIGLVIFLVLCAGNGVARAGEADVKQLTAGVKALGVEGAPGPVAVFGKQAWDSSVRVDIATRWEITMLRTHTPPLAPS